MAETKVWTEKDIVDLLEKSNLAVQKAILRIYGYQTRIEQNCKDTNQHNGCGFSKTDAPFGSILAERIQANQFLSAKQLEIARKMAIKYRRQLMLAANGKL